MQASASVVESAFNLQEPVSYLLREKGREIWSISPEETVYEAVEQMSNRHIGSLLVLSGGRLAGIVTERDYARKVVLKGRHSKEMLVREIMTTPVLFVTPEQTVCECMRLMTDRRVRHLPVMDGDRVAGMVSIGDLVNWIMASQDQTIRHLTSYITGTYPG